MKLLNYVGLGALLLCSSSLTQAQRSCASHDVLMSEIAEDPARAAMLDQIERQTADFVAGGGGASEMAVITIPVVFHVVYNTTAENISDARILAQLQVLNEDFRRLNSDADGTWPQAADTEIQFCLATVDPNGNPTTGITRTSTSVTSFGSSNTVKFNSSGGKDAWPRDSYLNYWVCDLSGGLLGYAQFPGGSASTDGVVCDYLYTGTVGSSPPFNLGRTGTHEVGHWLNLRHIWGDGGCGVDDFVADTPVSDGPNYGCSPSTVSCSTVDMVQNYMDYSDDACMNLFTLGQKTRMQAIFAGGGARASILNSGGCGVSAPPTCTDGIQNGFETGVDCGGPDCPECPPCTSVFVSINLDNYPEETSWNITNSSGGVVASGGTYGSQPDGSNVTIVPCLTDGCYDFTIFDSFGDGICCGFGTGDYTVTVGGSVVASGGAFTSSETTNFCVGGGGGGCTAPTGLVTNAITSISARPTWSPVAGALSYQAQGRRAGTSVFRVKNVTTSFVNVPGLNPSTSYEWQVRVTCADGSVSPFSPLSSFTTSAAREMSELDVKVFPNPANDVVEMIGLPEGSLQYTIFDRTGRLVFSGMRNGESGGVSISTTDFVPGFYIIKWHTDELSGVANVLVMH